MSWIDLLLLCAGAIITSILLRYIQTRPIEGFVGLIDLLIYSQDPRIRVLRAGALIILPLGVGFLFSIPAENKYGVGGLAPGLGAFISVSAFYFRPDIILPEVRQNIKSARLVFLILIGTYGSLGFFGAWIFLVLVAYFDKTAVFNNLLSTGLIFTLLWVFNSLSWRLAGQSFREQIENTIRPIIGEEQMRALVREEIADLLSQFLTSNQSGQGEKPSKGA